MVMFCYLRLFATAVSKAHLSCVRKCDLNMLACVWNLPIIFIVVNPNSISVQPVLKLIPYSSDGGVVLSEGVAVIL